MVRIPCPNCGLKDYFWIFEQNGKEVCTECAEKLCENCGKQYIWYVAKGGDKYCDNCAEGRSGPSGSSDIAWTAQKGRITEKATKNLNSNKHVYVPPINESTVGGVFNK